MGAFCCCPCGEDFEEYAHPSSSIYRHCICIRYFFYQLFGGYSGISQRLEGRAVTSSGVTPLTSTGLSTASADSSLSESYHLVPRPAPYDTDPRYSRSQRDGLVSRREKGTSHNQDESEMLRRNSSSSGVEHLGADYTITNTEDDDVCPTCLEEYTPENPKIITKCTHHFHLGCIYEWMERSDHCPICGKEMEFCESP